MKGEIKIGFGGKPRIPKEKVEMLLDSFAADLDATQASKITKVNRNTANLYYNSFREAIMDSYRHPPRLKGKIEIDQAFFGARRRKRYDKKGKVVKQNRENKVQVFGIIQRGGDVYTHIIKRADKRVLIPIIHMVIEDKSTIYSDEWRSFNRLIDSGYKHFTVNHSRGFSKGKGIHTNTIENYWSFAKRRLSKFNGISRDTFPLHMKECEFRYNNRKKVLNALKKII